MVRPTRYHSPMDPALIAAQLRDRLLKPDDREPHQRPPDPFNRGWVLLAGRGAGKTYAGMRWLHDQASSQPQLRARIIAPTLGDGVASCVDGPNGLKLMSMGSATFNPSAPGGACVSYPNGSRIWVIGTPGPREVDRLRALTNIEVDVFEEAFANPMLQQAWDQAKLSRRRGHPRFVITSTPRPHPLIKRLQEDDRVHFTRATARDNTHLDPEWLAELEESYKGTRLYRQEVLGEVIEDVEGALWTQHDVERSFLPMDTDRRALIEDLPRIMIGVDPAVGTGTTGIVVVGRGDDGHLYVLDDQSLIDSTPHQWASRVAALSAEYGAGVVAEVNQGGKLVTEVLRRASPGIPIHTVHAAKSKQARAEPVSLLWEVEHQTAHFVHHPSRPDAFAKLIDELTTWEPDTGQASPDRLDAMVWACTYLFDRRTATLHTSPVATSPSAPEDDTYLNSFSAWRRGIS